MSTADPAASAESPGVVGRLLSRWRSRVADPVAQRVEETVRADDDPVVLMQRVGTVEQEIDRLGGVLPPQATVLARLVTDGAREILRPALQGGLDIQGRIGLDALLRDYLPTTLTRYVGARRAGATDAVDRDLVEQLEAMRSFVQETLVAAREDDVLAHEVQGVFLRTKFAGSDL